MLITPNPDLPPQVLKSWKTVVRPFEDVVEAELQVQPNATILDSCGDGISSIHLDPRSEFVVQSNGAIGGDISFAPASGKEFFDNLQRAFNALTPPIDMSSAGDVAGHACPWVIFASYDLADLIWPGKIPAPKERSDFPLLIARRYGATIVWEKDSPVRVYGLPDAKIDLPDSELHSLPPKKRDAQGPYHAAPLWSREEYDAAFAQVKACIESGEFYQANLTQQFEVNAAMRPGPLFLALRQESPAPFSAFFPCGDGRTIVSSSPERFVRIRDGKIETCPIKGTRGVIADDADEQTAAALLASEKDRTELTIIVDLMRNDLSRICKAGSVKTPELFRVESFKHVHHLVSTITGELREEVTFSDLLQALMPGGSITGAPKLRVLQEMRRLEPWGRGPYTGSLFVLGHDGSLDSNILIRTITCEPDRTRFGVGGGIVWDSDCDDEYAECEVKAKGMQAALAFLSRNDTP